MYHLQRISGTTNWQISRERLSIFFSCSSNDENALSQKIVPPKEKKGWKEVKQEFLLSFDHIIRICCHL